MHAFSMYTSILVCRLSNLLLNEHDDDDDDDDDLAPDRYHASTSPLKFFTGQMPFLPPNQQRQSTEGKGHKLQLHHFIFSLFHYNYNLTDMPMVCGTIVVVVV